MASDETTTPLGRWLARGDDEQDLWGRLVPGPSVDDVARRLSAVPRSFLEPGLSLRSLVGDVLDDLAPDPLGQLAGPARRAADVAGEIDESGHDAARRGAAVALWTWASQDELGPAEPRLLTRSADRVLAALAWRLAPVVDPRVWLADAERRDEAARSLLFWGGQLPAGEDAATARALLEARDSLRRDQSLSQALAEQQHRLEVMRRLREARAREAAARPGHE
ncbi:phosphohydrolase [Frigoribacterium faeni]|uniref:phosphohydrolase n=1 Tax=Frigoribacterium faeni TaxID=145483 RepID=UPI00141ABDE4|nr:phosphohydrolase [Frigoribacterium faeni]NIJ04894.1 hypothetical protein [Frigoribacterium faeni]